VVKISLNGSAASPIRRHTRRDRALPTRGSILSNRSQQPRQLVARVLQDAHVAQNVLHVCLLEEPQAPANLERNIATLELQLYLQRVPVAAVEHRDVVEAAALVQQVQHVLGDEARLGLRPDERIARRVFGSRRAFWAILALASVRISGTER